MAKMKHSGGVIEVVLELGFDAAKYFGGTITSTPQMISISPPARRLTLVNRDEDNAVYINITGDDASSTTSLVPGDNLRVGPGNTFEMDFDALENISLVTASASVEVDGLLGWKGIQGN